MGTNEIKTLLNKFYDGETTVGEEQLLRDYFASDGVDGSLAEEKAFFCAVSDLTETSPEGGLPRAEALENSLERQIDAWNKVEKNFSRKARRISLRWMVGAAAGILLLIGIGLYVSQSQDEPQYALTDTYDNPEDAYAETQKALVLFSERLNKGIDRVNKSIY